MTSLWSLWRPSARRQPRGACLYCGLSARHPQKPGRGSTGALGRRASRVPVRHRAACRSAGTRSIAIRNGRKRSRPLLGLKADQFVLYTLKPFPVRADCGRGLHVAFPAGRARSQTRDADRLGCRIRLEMYIRRFARGSPVRRRAGHAGRAGGGRAPIRRKCWPASAASPRSRAPGSG